MVYMHPYEFDSQDLKRQLNKSEGLSLRCLRITQNLNRKKSEKKLRNLLSDFAFSTAAEVLQIDR
jgi:hypothetical protein